MNTYTYFGKGYDGEIAATTEHDIRLAAYAPDLLAAAIAAEDLLAELEDGGAENPELEYLRAAIAKAKGE